MRRCTAVVVGLMILLVSASMAAKVEETGRSPLSRRLEIASALGVDWLTDDLFNPVSEDPWWGFARVRATVGIDAFAVELGLAQHVALAPYVFASRTVEIGVSTTLSDVSLSASAWAWIEPRFLFGWIRVAARGSISKWLYWETYYSIPIRTNTSASIGIMVGVQLKVF